MKHNYLLTQLSKVLSQKIHLLFLKKIITILFIFGITFFSYSQKKGGGKGNKDIIVRSCVQYIGNGLYQVNFGYENPNKKEVNVNEENSFVKFNNGNNKSKGLNKFKSGSVDRAFTREFGKNQSVAWTVINPSGKEHTVIANANSSHCPSDQTGFIVPLTGQGNGKVDESFIIGHKLFSLSSETAGDIPSGLIFQLDDSKEKVQVVIVPNENKMQQTIDLLLNKYFIPVTDFLIDPVQIISQNLTAIDVFFPITELENVNIEIDLVKFVRPIYIGNLDSGIVTTQGDSIHRSNNVREAYRMLNEDGEIVPVDGRGIEIGIISDSFDSQPFTGVSQAQIDVGNGDLGDFEIIQEYPFGVASDEGRAMAHIIHDIAPGSKIGFWSGVISQRGFELGVNTYTDNGYDMIVDDITFITEPFFGTSLISQAIQTFTSLPGNTYFSSAGNFGNKGGQGVFTSSTISLPAFLPDPDVQKAHVFDNANGVENIYQKINVVPGIYMIVLQSNEPFATQNNSVGAINDLDLYIVDESGNLLVGNNRVNIDGDPTEVLFFESKGTGEANIMIISANGDPGNLPFRFIAFRSNGLEIIGDGAPTISGHAMAPEVKAIGAVNAQNAQNPTPAYYSSFAGTLSNGETPKISLSGTDGVFTNVASIGQLINENDIYTSFYGTSAAAPHAAALMALHMSAQPAWNPDGLSGSAPALTNPLADQSIILFQQHSTLSGNPDQAGAGLPDLEQIFKAQANPTPILLDVIIEDSKTAGIDSVQVTLIGKYFLSEDKTKVFFNDKELNIISMTETEIVVQVEPFTSNPCIIVNSESQTNGGDGGDSNCLQLLDDGKLAINIIADDLSNTFGQSVQMTFTVEGLSDSENLESSGLPELQFSTPAVFPYPDVNNYVITPYFDIELTEEQSASFQINFVSGILSITKTDLTVQPEDAYFIYGEPIIINSNFIYLTDGIENNNDFLTILNSDYQSTFYPDNTLILVNKFRAVVNEYDFLNILNDGAWMASDKVIQNKFRAVVNGMNFVDLDMDHLIDYKLASEDATTNKFRAVVNKFRAVVNGIDLLSNNVEISIENKFRAVVNSSGLGDENDLNSYNNTFSLIDADDASDNTQENAISKLFSTYLITGKDATLNQEGRHIIYPGALLHPIFANFNKTFAPAKLTILPKELEYTTNDIVVNQDEYPDTDTIIITFNDNFAYNETVEIVFPNGKPEFYFVNENGDEFEIGDTGVFHIKIREPQIDNRVPLSNYSLINNNPGRLFINPSGNHLRKTRTYLDCVEEITNSTDGLNFIAHFRYENPNSETIYVLHGLENNISGTAAFDDTNLPYVFLPGQGTFEIPFDASNGNKITWNLTTFDSTHKTSVSSDATADSGKCDAKQVGNTSYTIFPNPVENVLTIQRNVSESSTVDIYDMYGILHFHDNFRNNGADIIEIDVSSFSNGIYYVRITSNKGVSIFNIMKE